MWGGLLQKQIAKYNNKLPLQLLISVCSLFQCENLSEELENTRSELDNMRSELQLANLERLKVR